MPPLAKRKVTISLLDEIQDAFNRQDVDAILAHQRCCGPITLRVNIILTGEQGLLSEKEK